MSTPKHDERAAPRRGRGDDGAGLVEFALISVLLLTLAFGIMNFGLILSFDQDVTRAAAEGARTGAVVLPTGPTDTESARLAAQVATNNAVKGIGGRFATTGCTGPMQCTSQIVGCSSAADPVKCVKVTVTYDYAAEPIYGDLPIISAFLPDKVQATSVARINQ